MGTVDPMYVCLEMNEADMQINKLSNDNYFVDVSKNIIKGSILFGGLSLIFGVAIIAALFFIDDPVIKEQETWCEQYHPTLSFSECSKEAGW